MIRNWLRKVIKYIAMSSWDLKSHEYFRNYCLGDTPVVTFLYSDDYVEIRILGQTIYRGDKEKD